MSRSIVKEKSFAFAVAIARLCIRLSSSKKEYVLSKQLLRSGTSIGSNIRTALNTMTDRDFIYNLSVSQKECDETLFWLEVLNELDLLTQDEFSSLRNQAHEILRILRSIILTKKSKLGLTSGHLRETPG